MNNEMKGGESLSEETRQVMEELRNEGLEFEGDELKSEPPKEEPPKPKEEAQPLKEELKKEQPLEIEQREDIERKPREPKQIPAWKAEIEKKRLNKEWEDKSAKEKEELLSEVNNLKSEIEKLKSSPATDKNIDEQLKEIADEFNVEEGFLKKLYNIIPKGQAIPDDVKEKLASIEELREKSRQENEDLAYNKSFSIKVMPVLRENYPHITDDEIGSIKDKMKGYYFSDKYLNLDSNEIYAIKSSEFKDMIAPPKKESFEKGSKGVSRDKIVVDYDNLTEEEYANLSSEEQDNANEHLIRKQRAK